MKQLLNIPAKLRARKAVTREVKRRNKTGKVELVTLFHDNFDHEKEVSIACPNATCTSINFDREVVEKHIGHRISRSHSVVWGKLGTTHDDGFETPQHDQQVIWYDFCRLVDCWEGFFAAVKRCDVAKTSIFVTFSVYARCWDRSPFLVEEFGKFTTPDDMAGKVIARTAKLLKKQKLKMFYDITYTVTGGRMITMGFRKGNNLKNHDDQYLAAVKAADSLREAGVSTKDIAALFGNTRKIAGLMRAATCRK